MITAAERRQRHVDRRPERTLFAPHVDGALRVRSRVAIGQPPRHPLTLADLAPHAAASQAAHPSGPPASVP